MQTKITWSGRHYNSIEHCIFTETGFGNEITSTITSDHEDKIYKVGYTIKTNRNWETIFAALNIQYGNKKELITLAYNGGKYLLNGKVKEEFSGIHDIDISLTPFTNTLPINRLQLKDNEQQVTNVIYFDILEKEINQVKQVYTRLAGDQYIFEHYDKSFKAVIKIDEEGFVVDYPELFSMTAKSKSRYS